MGFQPQKVVITLGHKTTNDVCISNLPGRSGFKMALIHILGQKTHLLRLCDLIAQNRLKLLQVNPLTIPPPLMDICRLKTSTSRQVRTTATINSYSPLY